MKSTTGYVKIEVLSNDEIIELTAEKILDDCVQKFTVNIIKEDQKSLKFLRTEVEKARRIAQILKLLDEIASMSDIESLPIK